MEVPGRINDDPLPHCTKHSLEKVMFFCRIHELTGCTACMVSHSRCRMDYIPDISKRFFNEDEFINYSVILQELKTRFAEGMRKVTENRIKVDKHCEQAIKEIKSIKNEIIKCLDEFETELEKKVSLFKDANTKHIKDIESDLESLRKKTLKTEDLLDKLRKENKYNAYFLEFKHSETFLIDCQEKLYEISTKNFVKDLVFVPLFDQTSLMSKENVFGIIEEIDSKAGPLNAPEVLEKEVGTVSIQSRDDRKLCYVSDLVPLSYHLLAVADKNNKKVKIVDVTEDTILSEISFTSEPNCLTIVGPESMAVVLNQEKSIRIITNFNELTVKESFRTNGKCLAVKYDAGILILTYENNTKPRVDILSLSGEIQQKVIPFESSDAIKKEATSLELSPDYSHLYITGINKALLRLSKQGAVTGYNNEHKYTGVAVSFGGSVYACSKEECVIVQLSDDLSVSETVLTRIDGIESPLALAICKARNIMFVSSASSNAAISNRLLVFKIKLDSKDVVLYERSTL